MEEILDIKLFEKHASDAQNRSPDGQSDIHSRFHLKQATKNDLSHLTKWESPVFLHSID